MVGCFKRTASKHVYYLGWNRSPAQVGCIRQALGPGALGKPRGSGWRGRWEGGSGWGTHVNPWLFHFNIWQNPPQIKKKKNIKKKKERKKEMLPRWHIGKESVYQCRRPKICKFNSCVGNRFWNRIWKLTPVFLPGTFHRQRSLLGYSSWSCKELDMTEHACNPKLHRNQSHKCKEEQNKSL